MFVLSSKKSNSLSAKFRNKRASLFLSKLKLLNKRNLTMLDMGGTIEFWMNNPVVKEVGLISTIDVVNLDCRESTEIKINTTVIRSYHGNALEVNNKNGNRFDVVHSNSVIEHVGNLSDQYRMAKKCEELRLYYWVQTPYKFFPIEPHFYFPFFAYLPLTMRSYLHQRFDMGFMKREPNWLKARISCENTRLLTVGELKSFFQHCDIIKERFIGFNKSIIATNIELK